MVWLVWYVHVPLLALLPGIHPHTARAVVEPLPHTARAGFNPGSTGCFYGCMLTASRVAVNTTLSAATGGLTVLFLSLFLGRPGDIGPMLNGIITALVAITSPCAMVYPYAAVVIGMVRARVQSIATCPLNHATNTDCGHGLLGRRVVAARDEDR